MPTYCTAPARYRRIRSNSRSSPGRFAGRPDSSDHRSGPGPTAPKPSQLPKTSKPECASDSLFGAVPRHGTHSMQLAQQRYPTSVPYGFGRRGTASHSQLWAGVSWAARGSCRQRPRCWLRAGIPGNRRRPRLRVGSFDHLVRTWAIAPRLCRSSSRTSAAPTVRSGE
jgi:hypothetical protein